MGETLCDLPLGQNVSFMFLISFESPLFQKEKVAYITESSGLFYRTCFCRDLWNTFYFEWKIMSLISQVWWVWDPETFDVSWEAYCLLYTPSWQIHPQFCYCCYAFRRSLIACIILFLDRFTRGFAIVALLVPNVTTSLRLFYTIPIQWKVVLSMWFRTSVSVIWNWN